MQTFFKTSTLFPKRLPTLLGFLFFCAPVFCFAEDESATNTVQEAEKTILEGDLKTTISVLASDALEGRGAGVRGGKAAASYLVQRFRQMELQPLGENNSYSQYFGNDYRNLFVVVPGSDPKLKKEYILVGAHYDHVGRGNPKQNKQSFGQIHNGADDNASGTAALLELAEALTSLKTPLKRSVIFAFWDAEEIGLLGSFHWTKNPTVPLAQVKLSINLDMIGRLKTSLTVYGSRTANGLRHDVTRANAGLDLNCKFSWDSEEDSDHYPFFKKSIPYLMLFSGYHADYHLPGDDANKINYAGAEQITRLAFRLLDDFGNRPTLPEFRAASFQESESARLITRLPRRNPLTRLGVLWSKPLEKEGIIRLTQVADRTAAANAGLRIGDEILEFGGYPVNKVGSFTLLIITAKNPVRVVVKRKGIPDPLVMNLTLAENPVRVGLSWMFEDVEPGRAGIRQIVPGTPAHLAGLKIDDRILSINGKTANANEEMTDLLLNSGNVLTLVIERNARIQKVTLKLLPSPEDVRKLPTKF